MSHGLDKGFLELSANTRRSSKVKELVRRGHGI